MNPNNLIFSSKIDPQIEDTFYNVLEEYLSDVEFDKVYVKNVVLSPNEVLFFAEIEELDSIIRVPLKQH